MNPLIARAVSYAVVAAVWVAISHFAKLPLQVWPVFVGLACSVGAGGGVPGAQKAVVGTASGVVWALLGMALVGLMGRSQFVDVLVTGAVVFGIVFQGQVPLLGYTTGGLAGAATAYGTRAVTVEGGLRTAIALAIGVGLGYAAEQVQGMIKPKRG